MILHHLINDGEDQVWWLPEIIKQGLCRKGIGNKGTPMRQCRRNQWELEVGCLLLPSVTQGIPLPGDLSSSPVTMLFASTIKNDLCLDVLGAFNCMVSCGTKMYFFNSKLWQIEMLVYHDKHLRPVWCSNAWSLIGLCIKEDFLFQVPDFSLEVIN